MLGDKTTQFIHSLSVVANSRSERMANFKLFLHLFCSLAIIIHCEAEECPDDWFKFGEKCFTLKGPLSRKEAMAQCKANPGANVMKPPLEENEGQILAHLNVTMGLWLDVKRNRKDNIYRWDDGKGQKVIQKNGRALSSRVNRCVKYRSGNFNKVECQDSTGWVVCVLDPGSQPATNQTTPTNSQVVEKLQNYIDELREEILDLKSALYFQDCQDIQNELGSNFTAGVFEIFINFVPTEVYCDEDGFTVIQSRGQFGNPMDYFFREWKDYLKPFGTPGKVFTCSASAGQCFLKVIVVLDEVDVWNEKVAVFRQLEVHSGSLVNY